LRSGDVRAASAALAAGGRRVLRPEPTRGAGGCWVQFVHPRSAGGVLLELSEPAAAEGDAALDGGAAAAGGRR
jgi:methylmalonyl-CoA/ethylmalonyl-CoA epimerase